jgi:hypothetical protein
MPFCDNCGTIISKTAKFCSNCGVSVVVQSSLDKSEKDDKIYEVLVSFFFAISQTEKVYLGDNIPQKKLNAFASNFGQDIISFVTAYVYHDITLWGKGDDGYIIAQGNDNNLYLLLNQKMEQEFGNF